MKTPLVLYLLCLGGTVAEAQNYTLDWWTIDGGAGTSTGAVYEASSTIGQPDAGTNAATGGPYTLVSGFWGVVLAVQTPGAPILYITRTNSLVTVSWTSAAEGWVLQQSSTLTGTPPPWTLVPPPYQTNATRAWITVPVPAGNKFYRLNK